LKKEEFERSIVGAAAINDRAGLIASKESLFKIPFLQIWWSSIMRMASYLFHPGVHQILGN
jgi:hypothetical protein